MKNHIVAIVYPDPEELKKWCIQQSIGSEDESHVERVKHPEVFSQIESDFAVIWKSSKLNSLEKLGKNFAIVGQEFEVGRILTPTMKIKRNVAREAYLAEIEAIYTRADELAKEKYQK
jgi:long-subunit acyl-CoA synthetase (AMP-forming)